MLENKNFLLSIIPINIKIIITKHYIIFISSLGFVFLKYQDIFWVVTPGKLLMLNSYIREMSGIKTLLTTTLFNCYIGIFIKMYIKGVGFKCWCENSTFVIKLGFSNIVKIQIPTNIIIKCISRTEFCVYGLQNQTVANFCMLLRSCRCNNIYKQIGIYFSNEIIILRKLKTKKESYN